MPWLREQLIAHLQLDDVAAAAEDVHVEIVRVRDRVHQEVAGAQRPALLVQLGGRAIGQAELVGRIVERAGRPDRPVHEVLARVLGVGVAVEHVEHGEFADLQGEPRHVLLAGELQLAGAELLLLAAEAEGLAQEKPRGVVVRIGKVRLLRLAIGEAAKPDRVAEAEALQQFGIVIDLAAVPQPRIDEQAVAPGFLELACRGQAVGAGVGSTKRRISLADDGGLAMDLPAIRLWIGRIALELEIRAVCKIELAVEPDAQGLKFERGSVAGAVGEAHAAVLELAVEIFQPPAPMRREARSMPAPAVQPTRVVSSFSSPAAVVLMKRPPVHARPPVA